MLSSSCLRLSFEWLIACGQVKVAPVVLWRISEGLHGDACHERSVRNV